MQAAMRANLFHVASSKENNWNYPTLSGRKICWCKYNQDKENGKYAYLPGLDLPLLIVIKLKPIFDQLRKYTDKMFTWSHPKPK